MANSNGLRSTWAKHNRVLNGHLDQVPHQGPGLVERNERLLREHEERQIQEFLRAG